MRAWNQEHLVCAHEQILANVDQSSLFVGGCQGHGTEAFLIELARQRVRVAQTSLLLESGFPGKRVGGLVLADPHGQFLTGLREFCAALDQGYVSETNEILCYFSCALTCKDWSKAHFLASLPTDVWWDGQDTVRWQAYFGFAVLRGEEDRTKKVLDYLEGLCFDGEAGKDPSPLAECQRVTWRALEAIYRRDAVAFSSYLKQRLELWPQALSEEQRNDCFYLYDLVALGFIRLAEMRCVTVQISHPGLPLALLGTDRE